MKHPYILEWYDIENGELALSRHVGGGAYVCIAFGTWNEISCYMKEHCIYNVCDLTV